MPQYPVYQGIMPQALNAYLAGLRVRQSEEDRRIQEEERRRLEAERQRLLREAEAKRAGTAGLIEAAGKAYSRPPEDFVVENSIMPYGGAKRLTDGRSVPAPDVQPAGFVEATPLRTIREAGQAYEASQAIPGLAEDLSGSVLKGADPSVAYNILKGSVGLQEDRRKALLDRAGKEYQAGLKAATAQTKALADRYDITVSDGGKVITVFDKITGTYEQARTKAGKTIKKAWLTQSKEPGKPGTLTILFTDGTKRVEKVEDLPADVRPGGGATNGEPAPDAREAVIKKARELVSQGKVQDAQDLLIANKFKQNEMNYIVGEAQTLRGMLTRANAILKKYGGGEQELKLGGVDGLTFSQKQLNAYETLKKRVESGKATPEEMLDLQFIDQVFTAVRAGTPVSAMPKIPEIVPYSAGGKSLVPPGGGGSTTGSRIQRFVPEKVKNPTILPVP